MTIFPATADGDLTKHHVATAYDLISGKSTVAYGDSTRNS